MNYHEIADKLVGPMYMLVVDSRASFANKFVFDRNLTYRGR